MHVTSLPSRGLHRFLLFPAACHKCGHHVQRKGESIDAQLVSSCLQPHGDLFQQLGSSLVHVVNLWEVIGSTFQYTCEQTHICNMQAHVCWALGVIRSLHLSWIHMKLPYTRSDLGTWNSVMFRNFCGKPSWFIWKSNHRFLLAWTLHRPLVVDSTASNCTKDELWM